jgi:hypothetical protein
MSELRHRFLLVGVIAAVGLLVAVALQAVFGSPAGLIALGVFVIARRYLMQRFYWPWYRQRYPR